MALCAVSSSPAVLSFHTVRCRVHPGGHSFVHGVLELCKYRIMHDPGVGPYLPRVALALRVLPN